jgi:hypothetical protein
MLQFLQITHMISDAIKLEMELLPEEKEMIKDAMDLFRKLHEKYDKKK